MRKTVFIASVCALFDQLIKIFVVTMIGVSNSIPVISDFFYLTQARNIGAAWSLFEGGRVFLILISLIAVVAIYMIFLKNKKLTTFEAITYGLLLGGITGNLIDRIFRGFVVDYLEFHIFGYAYPIFNLADILIVISVVLIIVQIIKEDVGDGKHKHNTKRR